MKAESFRVLSMLVSADITQRIVYSPADLKALRDEIATSPLRVAYALTDELGRIGYEPLPDIVPASKRRTLRLPANQ